MFYRCWFVCLSVCLSVTTISKNNVDGFLPNFMGRFSGGKGIPSSCFVTIGIEGCGSNGQNNSVNRRLFTFYTSIVGVASVAKCWRQKPQNVVFAGSCTFSEYFPSSCTCGRAVLGQR